MLSFRIIKIPVYLSLSKCKSAIPIEGLIELNTTPCFMGQLVKKALVKQYFLCNRQSFWLFLLAMILVVPASASVVTAADSVLRNIRQESQPDRAKFVQLMEAAKLLSQSKQFHQQTAKLDSIYNASLNLALTHNWEWNFLNMIDSLGVYERNQARYASSVFWHRKGLKLSDSLGLVGEKIKALNNLGVAHRRIDDYRQASDYHLSALALANEVNDGLGYVQASNGLGKIQFILGNYDEALYRFRECLSFEQKRNNLRGVALNLNNIGDVFFRKGEIDKALEYYLLSLEVNREAGSERGVANCYSDLGQVYKFRKEYLKGINYFLLSLELNEKLDDVYYLATSYIDVAEVYVKMDNYEQGMVYIEKGIAAAEQTSSLALLQRAYRLMYLINKDKGKYAEALGFFEKADVINDSILNNTISRTVIQMQTLFERERSESQIALLKQQKELAELQMRDQKLINLIGISGLIVLLVALLVGIGLFRMKSHSNKLLRSQKEEVEKAQQELSLYADKLLIAKEEAERHNTLKSQFLANMSHEIRTPMNSIIGFADILDQATNNPQKKSYIDSIRNSGRSLLLLINDILDLSKIEADKLQIKNEPLDLRMLFQEIQQLFSLQLKEKKLSLDIYIDEKLPKLVFLSETRMRQVFFNLVGNAIKFTPKGGIKIGLVISETDFPLTKDINFTIKDTGIGISPDGVDKIFETFYQHHTDSSKYQGTGLGLAITQRLVTAMNGTITVDSEVNKGTTFKITLHNVRIISDKYLSKNAYKSIAVKDVTQLPELYLVSSNPLHTKLIKEQADSVRIDFKVVNPGDELLKKINMQSGTLVFMDTDDFEEIDTDGLNNIMQSEDLKVVLIGSRQKISTLRIDPEFQFELPAQLSLLKRFLQSVVNQSVARLPAINDYIKIPVAKNEEEAKALKELEKMWQEAQNSNFIADAEHLAIKAIKLSEKFRWFGLEQYARKLKNAAEGFDIEQTKSLLNNFQPGKQPSDIF